MKKKSIVLFASLALVTLAALTANSTTVTVESDDFIRCLIGDCRDTDPGYSIVTDPFDAYVSGTDLGTFAKGDSYTYIFFGDTNPSPTGLYDVYLAVPNDELREFVATLEGDVTPEMNARFESYLIDRYTGDAIEYEYLTSWSLGYGFNVPTGAFFNPYNLPFGAFSHYVGMVPLRRA
jgi:hypothetical protein